MKKSTKKIILKISIILISIIAIGIVCYAFFPLMKELVTTEGRLEFKNKISEMGFSGFMLLYLLEAVQMLLVVIPGEPIEILYGMCYGSILGAIYITITVFINTIIVYYIVKKVGRKILVFYFSEEKVKKVEESRLLNDPKKVEYLMTILFFLPGTPKDLLLYIGALLPINKWKFILISTFVRFPSVITSTIAGDGITSDNFYLTIGIYVVTAIVLLIGFLVSKLIAGNKQKEIKEAMKDIK